MNFLHLIFSSNMASSLITLQVQLLCAVLPLLDLTTVTMAIPFTEEPQDQAVVIKETVNLTCIRHPDEQCNVFWYWVDEQTYLSRNKGILDHNLEVRSGQPHYSLSGNSSHDFTLTIHNVTSADAGSYQCICYGNSEYTSPVISLTVYIPPSPNYPSCRISEREESLFVGQRLNFYCSSSGGRPPANLKWMRGDSEVRDAEFTTSPHPISIYKPYLKPQDFGKIFTCVASSPALKTPHTCSIGPLYPTSVVQIDIIPETGLTEEHQPFSFGCSANFTEFGVRDYPEVANYTWYINDHTIEFGMSGVLLDVDKQFMFLNQTSDLPPNTQISCEVYGSFGSLGNATVIINEQTLVEDKTESIYQEVTKPTVFVVRRKEKVKFDIRPIVFINAGGLMLLATMILIVVCVPKQCRCCRKQPQSQLRRRDSRYADMQYTQNNGCPSTLLMTPETNMNTYESTDSDTESSKGLAGTGTIPTVTSMSQQQQVQATLHVVVHSANNQQQTTTVKASTNDDYDDQQSLYHELPPMPNSPPPPPPPPNNPTGSPSKRRSSFSTPIKIPQGKSSPTKTWNPRTSRSHSVLSYDHVPVQPNQYAPTTCTTTEATAGCYVRTLPLPGHNGKIIQSCLRCNHCNRTNNNHFATYHRGDGGVGVVYENIPLPPHTCGFPSPAPL